MDITLPDEIDKSGSSFLQIFKYIHTSQHAQTCRIFPQQGIKCRQPSRQEVLSVFHLLTTAWVWWWVFQILWQWWNYLKKGSNTDAFIIPLLYIENAVSWERLTDMVFIVADFPLELLVLAYFVQLRLSLNHLFTWICIRVTRHNNILNFTLREIGKEHCWKRWFSALHFTCEYMLVCASQKYNNNTLRRMNGIISVDIIYLLCEYKHTLAHSY